MADQVRFTLWACPRTCSSSFLKSMNKMPDCQIIFELYTTAWHFGPERDLTVASTFPKEPDVVTNMTEAGLLEKDSQSGFHSSVCTFDFCKKQLEAAYPGKRLVLNKEMASFLIPKYNYLPKGYRHVFLIRDPSIVFPSWKKIVQEMRMVKHGEVIALDDLILDRQPLDIMPAGLGFKETYEMYQYIKENNMDPEPIVIDAEDLVANPEGVLSAFCSRMGLPYSSSLLGWESGSELAADWIISQRHKFILKNAKTMDVFRNSTRFQKPEVEEGHYAKITPDVQRCIDLSMPYYEKMYEHRLKI
ncbi:uncharacterized protein LOC110978748 [Acanthaster planci]|uniref:Uncharacterized protein LOC110978748 n=1 Tax=Acanthaster planci TaxID=133434 RepID=A0A8B7YAV2_ACAPL|nr:uncharacterized protein LOC110978748 [Acanthaster planci]